MTKIYTITGLLLLTVACQTDYNISGEQPDVDPGDVTECGFTPISGTKMSRYDCNPVFSSTDEDWGQNIGSVGFLATQVLGHPFYQMWYVASPNNATTRQFGMGYAVSGDGTDWTVHEANPLFTDDPQAWDKDTVSSQVVVWDAEFDQYIMAYQGATFGDGVTNAGIWGLGISTSPDGVNWTKHPHNPVVNFQELGDLSPCWPMTINKATGGFRGYISATKETIGDWGFPVPGDVCDIYPMTALDVGIWTVGQTPVLSGGGPTDLKGMNGAAVVEFEGTQYMFYMGFMEWIDQGSYRSTSRTTLNLASSIDGGLTWAKDPNNPLPINLTANGDISNVSAQVVGERIHLWVGDNYEELGTDGSSAIGYFYFEPGLPNHP